MPAAYALEHAPVHCPICAVTAVVLLKPGGRATEAELMAHGHERRAGFKVPKHIVFVAEFPRTGTGKMQKHITRSQLGSLYTPDRTT